MKRWLTLLVCCVLLFGSAVSKKNALDDVKAQLCGRWLCFSGGALLNMAVEFRADGLLQEYTYTDGDWALRPADWTLIEHGKPMPYAICDAPDGLYPEGTSYELRVEREKGVVSCYGLQWLPYEHLDCEAFGIYREEAGGAYTKEGQKPLIDYGGWG